MGWKDGASLKGLFWERIEPFYCPVSDYHFFHLAIACEPLESPVHGSMDCSLSSRAFQYNTNCSFRCAEGFTLRGAGTVRCADLGQWTAPAPVCQGTVTAERCFHASQLIQGISMCIEFRHSFIIQTFTKTLLCSRPFVWALGMKWWVRAVLGMCSLQYSETQGMDWHGCRELAWRKEGLGGKNYAWGTAWNSGRVMTRHLVQFCHFLATSFLVSLKLSVTCKIRVLLSPLPTSLLVVD